MVPMKHVHDAPQAPFPGGSRMHRRAGHDGPRSRGAHHAHPLLVGLAALVWLLLRSGAKPSRIAYPCQRAALGGVSAAFALAAPPVLFGLARRRWGRAASLASIALLIAALALGVTSDSGHSQARATRLVRAPADYDADVFVVEHAGMPDGDRHPGIDRLVAGMGASGLRFFHSAQSRTISSPDGLIGADDVVLIKVNSQWPERGGTDTDVLKGLITRILEHPDGFHGEIVVVDNGQGRGSFDRPASNAEDHAQSVRAVVEGFAGLGKPVSAYLWDDIATVSVAEYADGDTRDGYVVGAWEDGPQIKVSYPKFRTAGGHEVSLKRGVWDPVAGVYDSTRLRFLNLPVLKTHGAYGVTGAVKHHVGSMTTGLGTNTHGAVGSGGIGAFLAEVRRPDLNILDCIYVLADPDQGPASGYADATWTDELVASRDPVALDVWAVANVLVPAMLANGHTGYPMQDPFDAGSTFRRYLDLTADRLAGAGIPVTNDLTHVLVHLCGATAVGGDTTMRLMGTYPNPFKTTTTIRFVSGRTGEARLDIYDLSGRLCRTIRSDAQRGAVHEMPWDGSDDSGRPLSAGAYYYRLTGAGAPAAGKVTRVR
jgi:hypothetical protein